MILVPRAPSVEKRRRTLTASRVALRDILARYVCVEHPAAIRLDNLPSGKPVLHRAHPPFEFNVSHTADLALIAVCSGVSLGVDVESIQRPIPNPYPLISRKLTHWERSQLLDLAKAPDGEVCATRLHKLLLTLWTRKEAFLKCGGQGIARGLRSFEMSVALHHPYVRSVDGNERHAVDWLVYNIDMRPPFVASLVARTPRTLPLTCFEWHPRHHLTSQTQ